MRQILLVEDSKDIVQMVEQAIGGIATVRWVPALSGTMEALSSQEFDLLILDVELPDGNGIEFCAQLENKFPNLPVFFLTGHSSLSEKVTGFAAGAADYITKPISPLELRARIEARLKKSKLQSNAANIHRWKELEINRNNQEVMIMDNGKAGRADLTFLEFKLLAYFPSTRT